MKLTPDSLAMACNHIHTLSERKHSINRQRRWNGIIQYKHIWWASNWYGHWAIIIMRMQNIQLLVNSHTCIYPVTILSEPHDNMAVIHTFLAIVIHVYNSGYYIVWLYIIVANLLLGVCINMYMYVISVLFSLGIVCWGSSQPFIMPLSVFS